MSRAKPKPQVLDCDPDPLVDVFTELQDEAQFRASIPPSPDPGLAAVAARIEAVHTAHDVKRAEIAAEQEARSAGVEPMVWKGHVYELAECIANMYTAGFLKAPSRNDAFEQACKHFVKPDGSRFSSKSLYQSLEQKRGFTPSR